MKKTNKINLDEIIHDLRLVPTDEFDNFMRKRWLPFLNSLDQEEQEVALNKWEIMRSLRYILRQICW